MKGFALEKKLIAAYRFVFIHPFLFVLLPTKPLVIIALETKISNVPITQHKSYTLLCIFSLPLSLLSLRSPPSSFFSLSPTSYRTTSLAFLLPLTSFVLIPAWDIPSLESLEFCFSKCKILPLIWKAAWSEVCKSTLLQVKHNFQAKDELWRVKWWRTSRPTMFCYIACTWNTPSCGKQAHLPSTSPWRIHSCHIFHTSDQLTLAWADLQNGYLHSLPEHGYCWSVSRTKLKFRNCL